MARAKEVDEQRIRELASNDIPYNEVAEMVGESREIVERVMNATIREHRADFDKWGDTILIMYINGADISDIAKMVDCDELLIKVFIRVNKYKIEWMQFEKELAKTKKAEPRIIEVGKEVIDKDTGKKYYDYTDVMIDRVGTQTIPQWKKDFERDGKTYFGIGEE